MQALGAAYQLSQAVELSPSSSGSIKTSITVGLRGEFDCAKCTDPMRLERGHCPFVENSERATVPSFIAETGDESDNLWACPKGVTLRNPGLWPTLSTFFAIQAASVVGYFGEGLVQLAPRVASTFAQLSTVEARFSSQIRKTRAAMDRRG